MNEASTTFALYRKLLRLYPREFRERLGESMEQTFLHLWNERDQKPGRAFFALSVFVETGAGILIEYMLLLTKEKPRKQLIATHVLTALAGLVLSVPLGSIFLAFMFDIGRLTIPLKAILTSNGYDLNVLGLYWLLACFSYRLDLE